jgi:hypothetical protein
MNEEQFKEFVEEVIPQQLFHVSPTDIDDENGGRLDETILVGLIANSPACLKYKPLQWFLDTFLIKVEPSTEEELFSKIQEDERNENESDFDRRMRENQEDYDKRIQGNEYDFNKRIKGN